MVCADSDHRSHSDVKAEARKPTFGVLDNPPGQITTFYALQVG